MNSNSRSRTAVALAATMALALPAGAAAGNGLPGNGLVKDYSRNSAGGDYSVRLGPTAQELRDRASTSQGGPAPTSIAAPTRIVTVSKSSGFEWGDAAIGAGAALVIVLLGTGGEITRRRVRSHSPAPSAGVTS
jgi:hypothetical protein